MSQVKDRLKPSVLKVQTLLPLELIQYFLGHLELQSLEDSLILEEPREIYVRNQSFMMISGSLICYSSSFKNYCSVFGMLTQKLFCSVSVVAVLILALEWSSSSSWSEE